MKRSTASDSSPALPSEPSLPARVEDCVKLLESLIEDRTRMVALDQEQRKALLSAAGRLVLPERRDEHRLAKKLRVLEHRARRSQDLVSKSRAQIRVAREAEVFVAPPPLLPAGDSQNFVAELNKPQNCYVCKSAYTRIHFFYDSMCPACAELNYAKRFQSASLLGKVALVTGGRVKIGFHIALKLLRAGAKVVVTTRFPRDAAGRFAQESDFGQWADRLHIYGLDLRHAPSVEIFCRHLEQTQERLDILINNAAQTVRRPPGFYSHLVEAETRPFESVDPLQRKLLTGHQEAVEALEKRTLTLPATHSNAAAALAEAPVGWHGTGAGIGIMRSAQLSQLPYDFEDGAVAPELFPVGQRDADLQHVDLRSM